MFDVQMKLLGKESWGFMQREETNEEAYATLDFFALALTVRESEREEIQGGVSLFVGLLALHESPGLFAEQLHLHVEHQHPSPQQWQTSDETSSMTSRNILRFSAVRITS